MNFLNEYSPCWKDLGTALVYQSPDFQFHSAVLITEFENCLIDKISSTKLYHAINPKEVTIYDDGYAKKLRNDAKDLSIVIISNQLHGSKLIIDSIKHKLEEFLELQKIPILAFFALKPNRLSKPHTGLWRLLNAYYAAKGKVKIHKACVVSDNGGRIIENVKKNGKVTITADISDTDRAFATNIGIPFFTINEYLDNVKKEKFTWSNRSLSPELRELYVEKLSQYRNPNIFAKLAELGDSVCYMIMIMGAPCSGKTTLSKELLHKWRTSEYGKTHAIKRFGRDKYTKAKRISTVKKTLENMISVIIDGECHTSVLRKPFIEIANKMQIPILYVEVNPGISMAYIFNHVAVETSQDENLLLYGEKEYYIYKATYSKPENTILYCPVIKQTKQVMQYRY